jgi:hypothetical protein
MKIIVLSLALIMSLTATYSESFTNGMPTVTSNANANGQYVLPHTGMQEDQVKLDTAIIRQNITHSANTKMPHETRKYFFEKQY